MQRVTACCVGSLHVPIQQRTLLISRELGLVGEFAVLEVCQVVRGEDGRLDCLLKRLTDGADQGPSAVGAQHGVVLVAPEEGGSSVPSRCCEVGSRVSHCLCTHHRLAET